MFNSEKLIKTVDLYCIEQVLFYKIDRTSSILDFIKATGAEYAIIPVGRKSIFGHPHKEVVERWLDSGAKIKRTGERGTISVSTDGRDFRIEAFQK